MPRLDSHEATIHTRAINARRHRCRLWHSKELSSRLFELPLPILLLLGLVMISVIVCIFALLFLAQGQDCWYYTGDFDLHQMMHASVHCFTTIGFGSVYPICDFAHVLVLLEQYLAYSITALLGAVMVLHCLQPHAKVRFADVATFPVKADGQVELTMRLVNETRNKIQHCRAEVHCAVLQPTQEPEYSQVELPLRHDFSAQILPGEHWLLEHPFSLSPLRELAGAKEAAVLSVKELDEIFDCILWVDLLLTVVDPLYGQQVRLHKRYTRHNLVSYAKFANMVSVETVKNSGGFITERLVTQDHARLNEYIEIEQLVAL
eukprot:TRINITY_DN42614_c0_g1_i1.p1 TRINITY_DN42614_c0_g1~~TRINITY_DN42614_c0_g1_i1.p1  ORF type:complete len:319 (-),score=40.15 TRINITY_DN42614_c0_g1_i1:60-1016(-)